MGTWALRQKRNALAKIPQLSRQTPTHFLLKKLPLTLNLIPFLPVAFYKKIIARFLEKEFFIFTKDCDRA